MKVLVNGGLNLSELDGWWAEAYSPEVGWALGDGREHGDDPSWDAAEAENLYALLEREVVPEFYARDERSIPQRWVERVRASMANLTPTYSTNRAVRQYTDEHYVLAASAFQQRTKNRGALGTDLVAWQTELAKHWPTLRFGSATVQQQGEQYLFQVQAFLDEMNPDSISVELYADGEKSAGPITYSMTRGDRLAGIKNGFTYTAVTSTTRPAADYTPRLIPQHRAALVPLESSFILWHPAPSWR
jgi:starch phosphorylase